MVKVLQHARFEVVGLDCDLYGDVSFGRSSDDTPTYDIDIRDVEFTDLLSFDAVVHLAALPECFQGELRDETTEEVNLDGTLRLAECCKQAQVPRFLFASSCAVYGREPGMLQNETSATAPLTTYARCKLEAERILAQLSDDEFCPAFLRSGTIYGVSPRLRLDTAVNDFVGSAVARDRIDLKTEGRAWRPFVHVEDLCRAFAAVLLAPTEMVRNQVFNVVPPDENHRVIEVADLVAELIHGCRRGGAPTVPDSRSYRVDGAKLLRTLPNFSYRWALEQGIRQLREALSASGLSPGQWRGERYRRLLRLQSLVERGELDHNLRSLRPVVA
jgi:nucleoside-diphosphate-sugar epimerase